MPLLLLKEIFMKWTTKKIMSLLTMSPTMKMTTKTSTMKMSSVIVYWCIMCDYVTIIIELIN